MFTDYQYIKFTINHGNGNAAGSNSTMN